MGVFRVTARTSVSMPHSSPSVLAVRAHRRSSPRARLACALPLALCFALTLRPVRAQEAPGSVQESAGSRPPSPNVVLIVADDVGYGDLSCYRSTRVPTPRLDALARAGVRFTSACVTAPVCAPSRAGILTGRSGTRYGFEFNEPSQSARFGLPVDQPTLAERLHAAGCATGIVGKWHLGAGPERRPTARGFDEFFGFLNASCHYLAKARNDPSKLLRGTERVGEPDHLTRAFAREAASFIERHAAQPFFLYLPFSAIHPPLEADPALRERVRALGKVESTARANLLMGLDDAVGVVLDRIESCGLTGRTLVVFVSDNGAYAESANGGLSGGKFGLHEGGLRVPLLMAWPGRIAPGTTFDGLTSTLDLVPTLLAATGVAVGEGPALEGVDLVPFLSGTRQGPPHAMLGWRLGTERALRSGDWKLVARGDEPAQLFDLASDPSERVDLAAREPARVTALEAEWSAWNASNIEPLWWAEERPAEEGVHEGSDRADGRKSGGGDHR